jgi:hypothetical protein
MASLAFRLTATLCLLRFTLSQIVGCDGPNIQCPTEDSDAKGSCAYSDYGIGVVEFDSNITEAPLTWTMTTVDDTRKDSQMSVRRFWLGTPPSINLTNTSTFGACSMVFQPSLELTSLLQVPPGTNLDNFGCETVMGEDCLRGLAGRLQQEASRAVEDGNMDDRLVRSPCAAVRERLQAAKLPESCIARFRAETYGFRNPNSEPAFRPALHLCWTLTTALCTVFTNGIIENTLGYHRSQDGCSVTTGGPEYSTVFGGDTNVPGSSDSEENQLFKNGTTPIISMFYNEPWNDATTGPFPGLSPTEPEVHVHCLRSLPSEEQVVASSGITCASFSAFRAGLLFWITLVVALLQV